jgi:hypothetical protein
MQIHIKLVVDIRIVNPTGFNRRPKRLEEPVQPAWAIGRTRKVKGREKG